MIDYLIQFKAKFSVFCLATSQDIAACDFIRLYQFDVKLKAKFIDERQTHKYNQGKYTESIKQKRKKNNKHPL